MVQSSEITADKQLVMTREFDAPRELVFAAWTEPEHFGQWWGPHGFSVPNVEMDLRPGGEFKIEMRSPDGSTYPSSGTFKEIVPSERLVMIEGNPMMELEYTVTFEDVDGKTRLTLTVEIVQGAEQHENALEGASMGFTQAFEKLEAHLGGMVS